jgi:hypothetical protein
MTERAPGRDTTRWAVTYARLAELVQAGYIVEVWRESSGGYGVAVMPNRSIRTTFRAATLPEAIYQAVQSTAKPVELPKP